MNRRHLLAALAATIAACGSDPRRLVEPPVEPPPPPPPCPTCGPKVSPVHVVPPPAPPWVGIEHLALLSQRHASPRECVRIAAEMGCQTYRVLSQIPRWGDELAPEPGWFVDASEDYSEWLDRRDEWDEECRARGVIGILCLFDEPERWNRPHVIAALRGEVIDPRTTGTWLDDVPGWPAARKIAELYLDGMQPAPHRIIETTNEPGDWPSGYQRPPEAQLAAWLRGRDYRVARGVVQGDDGPYTDAQVVFEHAWGKPGAVQPWPPISRLRSLESANPGVHVGLSGDGFALEEHPDAALVAGDVVSRGYSFSGLVRVAPDRWNAAQLRAVAGMVESARIRSAA